MKKGSSAMKVQAVCSYKAGMDRWVWAVICCPRLCLALTRAHPGSASHYSLFITVLNAPPWPPSFHSPCPGH